MRKFIIRLSVFGGLAITLIFILESLARFSPNIYKEKERFMTSLEAKKIETLILGSSHMYYGVNPELMSMPAYNLALTSQDIFYDDYLLSRYIDNCENLKTVVADISVFYPHSRMEDGIEWFRVNYYQLYMGCRTHSIFSKYNYEITYPRGYQTKILTGIKYLVPGSKKEFQNGGWGGTVTLAKRKSNWKNSGEQDALRHMGTGKEIDKNVVLRNTNCTKHIAQICKDRNIQLIFITPPAAICYSQYITEKALQSMNSMVDSARTIMPEVKYYNLLYNDYYVDDDFSDPDHLNADFGTKKFTLFIDSLVTSKTIN